MKPAAPVTMQRTRASVSAGGAYDPRIDASRIALVELDGPHDPRIAAAARASPLVDVLELSPSADRDELRFREHVESYASGLDASLGFFRRKRVLEYLDHVLRRTRIRPHGVVVELGAGSCWLSAAMTRFPEVE